MSEIQARLSAALADRYHIERELGQGGMATVYLAEDLKHKRKEPPRAQPPGGGQDLPEGSGGALSGSSSSRASRVLTGICASVK